MLEDDFNDCLMKAMLGMSLSLGELSRSSKVSESDIQRALNGTQHDSDLHTFSPKLGLNPYKLAALKDYQPRVEAPPELIQIVSPFGHLGVNAYIISHGGQSIIFDTGTDSADLHRLAPTPKHLFITHNHPDHNQGLREFANCEFHTPDSLQHGDSIPFGDWQIEVLDCSGHFSPARTYVIRGTSTPIAIVGDAIFAGSIGKIPATKYHEGLRLIRENILSLDDSTIICPGHGPMTTVAQELEHNPFF